MPRQKLLVLAFIPFIRFFEVGESQLGPRLQLVCFRSEDREKRAYFWPAIRRGTVGLGSFFNLQLRLVVVAQLGSVVVILTSGEVVSSEISKAQTKQACLLAQSRPFSPISLGRLSLALVALLVAFPTGLATACNRSVLRHATLYDLASCSALHFTYL